MGDGLRWRHPVTVGLGLLGLPLALQEEPADDDPVRLVVRRLHACSGDDGRDLDTATTRAEVLDFQGRRWVRIWQRNSGRWAVTQGWRETRGSE